MAVIIDTQPPDEPLQIGQPVYYKVYIFQAVALVPPRVQMQAFIEGSAYDVPKSFSHKSVDTDSLPGFGLYYFEVTINSQLQKYISQGNPFRVIGDYLPEAHDKLSTEFFVRFNEWVDDSTGFLELQSGDTDSQTRHIINAYIPERESQSLASFQLSSGNLFDVFRKRFSRNTLSDTDSDFLYYWAEGIAYLFVASLDVNGATISTAIKFITSAKEFQSIGIGPANINAMTENNAWDVGGMNINDQVKTVAFVVGSGFTSSREMYYNVGDCGSFLNLHFINQYGAVEVMKVNGSYTDEYRTESSLFKPNRNLSTAGLSTLELQMLGNVERFGITGFREITCSIVDIPESDHEFYRNFLRCKVVMLEESGQYQPFVVSDTKLKLYDSDLRLYIATFTIVGTREDKSHI